MAREDDLYRKYSAALDKLLNRIEPAMREMYKKLEKAAQFNMRVDLRNEAIGYMQAMVTTVSNAAASLSCDYFEQLMSLHTGKYEYGATMAEPADPNAIEKSVRYFAKYLYQEEPDVDSFITSCASKGRDYVMDCANRTVRDNCKSKKVRYARVPTSSNPCDFCLMLASRGFIYSTEEAAGEFDDFHPHCECRVVPGFGDNPTLKGYDPERLYEEWAIRRGDIRGLLPSDGMELTRKAAEEQSDGKKEVNVHLYNSLKNMIERHGGTVLRGGEEVERHLALQGAGGSSIGDIVFLTEHCTTSDTLEEWFHFFQQKRGDYEEYDQNLIRDLREIDAKEFLLSVTERYKIPIEEVRDTERELKMHRANLKRPTDEEQ